jgi:hypothetical protein
MSVNKRDYRKARKKGLFEPSNSTHWLGEGEVGQDYLIGEVEPFLYTADGQLCSAVASHAHRSGAGRGSKRSLFIPPVGGAFWPVGYLSKWFSIVIWTELEDEATLQIAEQFGAQLYAGEHPLEFGDEAEIILCTELQWQSSFDLATAVRSYRSLLSADGVLILAIPFQVTAEERLGIVTFADGSTTAVNELQQGRVFGVESPNYFDSVLLRRDDVLDTDQMGNFLKRHREYFGKNARLLLEMRINETDFNRWLTGEYGVSVCVWGSGGSEKVD